MPMFFVYIIYSVTLNKFYVGQTADLDKRLQQHNSNENLGAKDWKIRYSETLATRAEAMKS